MSKTFHGERLQSKEISERQYSKDKALVNGETRVPQKQNIAAGGALSLLSLLAFAGLVYTNFKTIQVSGDSMEPTFRTGQKLLASNAYWLVGEIKQNDIVVIQSEEPGETLIKRVYRLEGGKVDYLNVPDNYDLTQGPFIVPTGHIYILGDNREVSEDSRKFGAVARERILGKIVLKRWF